LSVLCVVLFPTFASAQSGTVRGRVTDKKTGEPLAGARVTLVDIVNPATGSEGVKKGTISGKDGNYEIKDVKVGRYTIQTTFVSYRQASATVTVENGGTATADLTLVPDIRGLDEVVVTGIASRNSKAVAEVSVGRVNAAEVTDRSAFTSTSQLLNGRVAGVTITQAGGNVGGGLRFNIRSGAGLLGGGNSNPLIFIDGVLVFSDNVTGIGVGGQQSSALADLNPSSIENIEILKGPAASALYGPQAQNGVVLITTKRGKSASGNDAVINYQGVFGWNEAHRLYREGEVESWQDVNRIFRRGQIAQHALNIQGSSGIFNYFIGYENRSEEGIVGQNRLDRQNVRLNLDAVTSKNLTIKGSASYTRNINDRPQNDNNTRGWLGNTVLYSPLTNPQGAAGAMGLSVPNRGFRTPLTEPARNRTGTYVFVDSIGVASIENSLTIDRFLGSAEMLYTVPFVPGLRLRAVGGIDLQSVRNVAFFPAGINYGGAIGRGGLRDIFNFQNTRTNFDLQATYDWSVEGVFKATSIVGSQLINTLQSNSDASALNYPTELIRDLSAGESTTRNISEFFANTRTAGIFARQELRFYDDLFSVSGGVRVDYSTAYGINAPFNIFPQVGGMLRLDKLNFLPEVINQAKLRVSYGQSGRLPLQLDGQRFLWQAGQSPVGAGAILNNAGNISIRPERVTEYEFGLDLEFDNAYGVEFTYYISNTTDGLVNAPRAQSTGLGNAPSNLGRLDGWGFESLIYARPVNTKDFALDFNLIVNYADNRVRDIGASAGAQEFQRGGGNANYLIPGYRRAEFFGLAPTTPRYLANGYYSFTAPRLGIEVDTVGAFRTSNGFVIGKPLGSSVPIFTGSFSINFRFLQDFTLYALAEYALGGNVYNGTRAFYTDPSYSNNPEFNRLATQLGIFGVNVMATNGAAAQERGPAAQIPTGRYPGVEVLQPNTDAYRVAAERFMRLEYRGDAVSAANYVEKADWVRIREVSLRWNAANVINELLGANIRTLSVGASVTNLALFTNYTGPEVEVNGTPATALATSYDFISLLQSRTVNFLVSFGF
jgi:TonB-dependent starch-binding outer membrane protein SusC